MSDAPHPQDTMATVTATRDGDSDESAATGASSSSAPTVALASAAPLAVADAAAHILAAAGRPAAASVPSPTTDSPAPAHVDTSCWEWLRGAPPAELPPTLAAERDALLAAAARGYDAGDQVHARLMHSLFQALTGVPFAGGPAAAPDASEGDGSVADSDGGTAAAAASTCSSSSWEAIGFQRPDAFDSDLRGVGLVGPLAALYLAQTYPTVSGGWCLRAGWRVSQAVDQAAAV